MLKSLLLATSVVIGSGSGAIQSGAHFNENEETLIVESQPKQQIYNESRETYELFTITTPDVYKSQQSYQKFQTDNYDYRANILRQQSRFSNAATIVCNTTSRLTYDAHNPAESNTKYFVAYIQIVPYLNYTNGEFVLNLNLNLYDDYNETYQQFYYTNIHILETEHDLTEFAYMGNYGEQNFPSTYYQNVINEVPAEERTIYYEEADHEDVPSTLKLENGKMYWHIEKTITITKNPKYIIIECEVEDMADPTDGLINWAPCYLDNTTIKCYVTRGGGTYEVVDLPGLLFDVLTMPFTFISRAFNVTLFPNTPYQLNIADIFIAIFAALVFMFIVKTFIKK